MLRSLNDLKRFGVSATDGNIGRIVNFLLDSERWAVRYLIVKPTVQSEGCPVLVSPIAFCDVDWVLDRFHLALTKDIIRRSPTIEMDQPVSRQHERDYCRHYGYTPYWGYSGLWGKGTTPSRLATSSLPEWMGHYADKFSDVRLRDANEINGYQIQGRNGPIGRVEDFMVDDHTWEVRYLAIDTSGWWLGKKVLVAPRWAYRVCWGDATVYVDLSREAIKHSPQWDATKTISREYETQLYDHYCRPRYWDESDRPLEAQPASHVA